MNDCRMRLISWNVAYRVGRQPEQLVTVAAIKPHIVALQEVTAKTEPLWRAGLHAREFSHVVSTFELATNHTELTGPRRYGLMLASPWPLQALSPTDFNIPWSERVLSAVMQTPWGEVECHTTHIPPGSSHGWLKVETLEGIYERLARPAKRPRVLCGDFNTPQFEQADGTIVTWGQRRRPSGEYEVKRGYEQWDAAERSILAELAVHDLPDVFRLLKGYSANDYSWYLKRGKTRIGRRFDHVFASPALNPMHVDYLHEVRETGLSDHAPITVCFAPTPFSWD